MNRIRASIVTYRTDPAELRRCIGALNAAGVTRVAVVDNSPDDSLRAVVAELGASYTHRPDNPGYGAAHNIELRRSLADADTAYHLVINSDVWFEPDTIRLIVAEMDRRGGIGQLIPRTFYPDGREQEVVRLLPTPFDLFVRRFLPKALTRARDRRYLLAFRDHSRELDVPYHQGSFMFLRTSALRSVGLFDERFFMYPEDIDLTRRINREYLTLYWPGARIVHAHRAASYKSLRMTLVHTVNMMRYFNKWGWFFDSERRRVNREVLAAAKALQAPSSH